MLSKDYFLSVQNYELWTFKKTKKRIPQQTVHYPLDLMRFSPNRFTFSNNSNRTPNHRIHIAPPPLPPGSVKNWLTRAR